MNEIGGRFHGECLWRSAREIERDLVRGARRRARERAGETRLDRPVQMAAQDALDLRMFAYDLRKRFGIGEPDLVHEPDAGGERRMMHEQQRWSLRRGRERQREPLQALRAQFSAGLAWNDGIDGDDAHSCSSIAYWMKGGNWFR